MNRNEFENWMKDKMQEQPFVPDEDMWQKLHADMQTPADGKKKAIVFLPWMKIAASVFVVLSLGVATNYFIKGNNAEDKTVVAGEKSYLNIKQKTTPETTTQPAIPFTAKNNTGKSSSIPNQNKTIRPNDKLPTITKDETDVSQIVLSNDEHAKNAPNPAPSFNNDFTNGNRNKQPVREEPNAPLYAGNNTNKPSLNLGMSANVGRSTVSNNVGYQVGIVGRGEISKRIFVEAGIVLASNTVSNSTQHSFPGMELGFDGLQNTENRTTSNVKANYARNIISIGINPAVGFKVTPRLSVSTGGAVYRNLNPSLELTNASDIESAALTNDIISTSQIVNSWDVGVTCNADYKVTKNLSFNVNYRKGLTDYLQQDNKYIKNSGVQLGLKFMLAR